MNVRGTPRVAADRDRKHPQNALVLTAGLGTRLKPLTYIRAKAAVPVNGETLARRVVRWLVSEGVRDLVLNLHHLPATITAGMGDGADLGARVRYSWEDRVLGSAGGPRRALPLLNHATFLIVNGDTLTDVNLSAMALTHAGSDAAVTMALIPNPHPDKYGGVEVADDRWVTGFSRAGSTRQSYHFIGVQMADARVFAGLEDGLPFETVNALYPALMAREPRSIAAFISDASFRDIGTPADYLATSAELAAIEGDRMLSPGARIDASASVVRCAVWDDVTIGADAEIVECIIGDSVKIPAGAHYRRCAIVRAGTRSPQGRERHDGDLLVSDID